MRGTGLEGTTRTSSMLPVSVSGFSSKHFVNLTAWNYGFEIDNCEGQWGAIEHLFRDFYRREQKLSAYHGRGTGQSLKEVGYYDH